MAVSLSTCPENADPKGFCFGKSDFNGKCSDFEGKLCFTKTMLSDYFSVDVRTIERYVADNQDELNANGYEILKGVRLKNFIECVLNLDVPDINVGSISNKTSQVSIFDFRAF